MSPGEFIPLAEEMGLIVDLDRWVLREACRVAARAEISMSVNLSAAHFRTDSTLLDDVAAALNAAGLAAADLTLELTETVLVDEIDVAVALLGRLKALGVRIAIDDFGTGFSSLTYLSRLPIDVLKIDRSFVQVAADDNMRLALARAVVSLGPTLGLETVAEGIERPEQLAIMRDLGCRLGQGYLLAPPDCERRLHALLDAARPTEAQPTQHGAALRAQTVLG